MCEWIYDKLDPGVPLHFSRFHPDYKLRNLPVTPIRTLERAYKIATDIGLNFVYIGNIYDPKHNSTYCPNCKTVIIERSGFQTKVNNLKNNSCTVCGTTLPIIT
jgi:pyruvate formate lyase activating enzyme